MPTNFLKYLETFQSFCKISRVCRNSQSIWQLPECMVFWEISAEIWISILVDAQRPTIGFQGHSWDERVLWTLDKKILECFNSWIWSIKISFVKFFKCLKDICKLVAYMIILPPFDSQYLLGLWMHPIKEKWLQVDKVLCLPQGLSMYSNNRDYYKI